MSIGGNFENDDIGNAPEDLEPETSETILYRDEFTNQLSEADIDRAPDEFTHEEFVEAYDNTLQSLPNVQASSSGFAQKIIDELNLLKMSQTQGIRPRGIFEQLGSLTDAEKRLVLTNPVKGYRSKKAADAAVLATQTLFSGSQYLTRADAFRHSYWSWLMSQCCGVQWAKAFATAHESEVPNNDDKRMDLNNNLIGRRLFTAAPAATADQAQSALLDYKLLWINSQLENVTVGIDYLVYLEPIQTMTVFDDGPEYDDIYELSVNEDNLGETPAGGSQVFEFDQMPSSDHSFGIYCQLDGTKGGCGFQIILYGALLLSTGSQQSPQIIIDESMTFYNLMTFPTMQASREN